MTKLDDYINTYKTPVSDRKFKIMRRELVQNPQNLVDIEKLEDKIKSIVSVGIASDKHYSEIRGALKDNILDHATGFAIAVTENATNYVHYRITDIINDMLEYPWKYDLSDEDVYVMRKSKEKIIDRLTYNIDFDNKKPYSDSLFRESLRVITDSMYANNNYEAIITECTPTIITLQDEISYDIQNNIDYLYEDDIIPHYTIDAIRNTFQYQMPNIKNSLFNDLMQMMSDGTFSIIDKINGVISDIFCEPRQFINGIGNALTGLISNFDSGGNPVGSLFSGISQHTTPTASGGMSSVKDKLRSQCGSGGCGSSGGGSGYGGGGRGGGCGGGGGNGGGYQGGNVQDRGQSGGSQGGGKGQGGGGGNQGGNDCKKPESDEPQEEQYDNEPPERAEVKDDPRRDNTQELLLWETEKEKYVLLRDGLGNYILFDEDKQCIRIQHKCGSYIQFASNGNIEIEAANHVRINCSGAKYINQF